MIENSFPPALAAILAGDDNATSPLEGTPALVTSETIETPLEDGGVEIMFGETIEPLEPEFDANLAEHMSESALTTLATELVEDVDADIESRKEWTSAFVKGLEVLGMDYEERTEPWAGACGVFSTVLTEAAVRFQSETIMETFPADGPVKTKIMGAIDEMKTAAATRVEEDMNFQLTETMVEYRSEHERLLYSLGLAGSAFKKVYDDPSLGRAVAMFVPAEDLIMPYGASNIETAERVTHVFRRTKNETRKLQVSGFYLDIELGDPTQTHTDIEDKKAKDQGYSLTDDDRYQFFEVHADLDIEGFEDEDGIARPYVVTLERGTQKIMAVRRNWRENDPQKLKRQHFVQYTYIPGFGVYGIGLINMVGGYAKAGTSLLRQLVDAGTLSNLPGGLKTRGLRVIGDDSPISPGEFRDVDVPSGAIRDNIMPLPYKEPSQVLAALLGTITDEGRRLGSIADMNISDMSAQAPVGTTLALLERQLKTMSAVQARVHFSMRREFKLIKEVIRNNQQPYTYTPTDGAPQNKQADYAVVEVLPVSDPNSATMAQRIAQYQAAFQMSTQAPQVYDLPMLHRQMLEVIGIPNADKLVPTDEDQQPRDPISENMAILRGDPVKAFLHQDQDAHIAVHTTFIQDPMIGQQLGQNPMAQQLMAAAQAHIAEHLGFQYRKKIEEQLGVPLPPPDQPLPPEFEVQLSSLIAKAAAQLLQVHKGEQAQAQAKQVQADPMFQLQQQELAIKGKKVDGDLAIAQGKLQLEQQKASAESPQVAAEIAQQEREAQQQAAQQQAQQAAQQQAQQAQQVAQQQEQAKAAHMADMMQQHQAHTQKLTHAQQVHAQKLRQMAAAKVKPNGQ